MTSDFDTSLRLNDIKCDALLKHHVLINVSMFRAVERNML